MLKNASYYENCVYVYILHFLSKGAHAHCVHGVSLSVNVCSKTCYIWFIYTLGSCYIFVFSICSVCINIYYVFCCNGK